jgi:quinol monooxygenase YgiN
MADVTVGLLVTLSAKSGKDHELAEFLESALPLVEGERETVSWFAFRIDESRFGIFDAFPGQPGREAHLDGPVAKALGAKAPELLAQAPEIQLVDVLAAKLAATPGERAAG